MGQMVLCKLAPSKPGQDKIGITWYTAAAKRIL